ncbi:MAG: TrkA family potassium uptake protein [Eubacteriales bacterium]|nr:TrkA family potassium uptake protein [Eubacteriales bacterium]
MNMKSYIVIGLGRFGQTLARQLCALGAEVLALDNRSDLVQQVADDVTHAVVGDGQDKEVLRALGARNFDCAIIAIGSNLAASVLTAMNLKELGVPYIICKAHDETHRKVLEKLGVDRVIIPEQENAQRLARSLNSHNVLEYIELSEDYGILEIPAPAGWIGKTIKELNVRAKLGVNIIAVENDKKTNVSPSADYQIVPGDVMVVLGDNYALEAVQKL